MSCYRPLHAFKIGVHEKTGKPKYLIESMYINSIRDEKGLPITNYIEIPCGKCIGCKLDYAKQWAMRCQLEAKQYENNAFITLTYNDENLPMVEHIDKETGEVSTLPTLKPEHLTKFMKDLRRYYEYHFNHKDIRFFACGEYGDQTKRPHYHIIVFNLPITDAKLYKQTGNGNLLFTSETIQKIWDKGFAPIGEATWESIAYTARYVMKKAGTTENQKKLFENVGIQPEFIRMSRKGGIGKNYFLENKEQIYQYDEIICKQKNGAASLKPGRYFDKLFEMENPEELKAIKEKRMEIARQTLLQEMLGTDLPKDEYLKVKEQTKQAQIKALKRNQI